MSEQHSPRRGPDRRLFPPQPTELVAWDRRRPRRPRHVRGLLWDCRRLDELARLAQLTTADAAAVARDDEWRRLDDGSVGRDLGGGR